MRDWSRTIGRKWFFVIAVYWILFTVLTAIVDLPRVYYETTRIVLWDTIVKALDRRQLMVVMGHEMGHYVLGHTWRLIAMNALAVLLFLYVVYRVSGALIRRYQRRFGFSSLGDRIDFSNGYRPWERGEPLVYTDRFK